MLKRNAWLKKNWHSIVFLTLLVVTILVWLIWGLGGAELFRGWICSRHSCTELGQIGDLFGGVNALFSAIALGLVALSTGQATRAHADDRQQTRDSEFLSQIERSYEWAYGVLTEDGKHIPPKPDRLNWLTAARHLVRCEKLSKRLESETYLLLSEEIREYWRHRFYSCLSDVARINPPYFLGTEGRRIELKSALVVISFSNWDTAHPDPLDDVDESELIDSGRAMAGATGRSLERYLVTFPHIIEAWDARRVKRGQPVPKRSPPEDGPFTTDAEQ